MKDIIEKAEEAQQTEISADRAFALTKHMSNWLKVSDIIYDPVTEEDTVLALLSYELKNRRRKYVADRIYSRYSNMRLQREQKELMECIRKLSLISESPT